MQNNLFSIGTVVIILSLMRGIELYSYMVPQESCFDLLPLHNSTPKLNATPYKILVKNKYFSPNEQVHGSGVEIINF